MLSRPELEGVDARPGEAGHLQGRRTEPTVPAYLTLPPGSDGKNLPAIVMPHGGPGSRDEWGFDWLAQYFAPRLCGAPAQLSRLVRLWRALVPEERLPVLADGDRRRERCRPLAGRQGIAEPGKLAIVGWSYGGYAALQSRRARSRPVQGGRRGRAGDRSRPAQARMAELVDFGRIRATSSAAARMSREGSPAQNAARIKAPVLHLPRRQRPQRPASASRG